MRGWTNGGRMVDEIYPENISSKYYRDPSGHMVNGRVDEGWTVVDAAGFFPP